MALWPFGRKKKKGAGDGDPEEKDVDGVGFSTHISGPEAAPTSNKVRPRIDSRQSSKQSVRKLSKTRDIGTATPPPPVPSLPRAKAPTPINPDGKTFDSIQPAKTRQPLSELPNPEAALPPPFFKPENAASQSSLQPENFSAEPLAPTLRAKRSSTAADVPPRRKSSKRRTVEKSREQEIKAMSSPIPIPKRPKSYTGGVLARDTKRIPSGLNRNFARPTSEVSLPMVESLRSSLSGPVEMQNSYKISAFDALSPRPTIKYSESARRVSGSPRGPTRASTRKEKGFPIPEEDFSPQARIDDLADGLDASGLRQLMERDRRRRDRKKKSDQDKLDRKLQKRSDKQKAEEAESEKGNGIEKEKVPDQGPERPEFSGLGIAQLGSVPPAEDRRETVSRSETRSPLSWAQAPSKENLNSPSKEDDDATDRSRVDFTTDDEREDPILETAQAIRLSTASISSAPSSPLQRHARGPSNLSVVTNQAPENQKITPEPPQGLDNLQLIDNQRGSDTGLKSGPGWSSFFRRSGTKARRDSADGGRVTPSEFSNASRESFQRSKAPPPMPIVQRSFKPKNGGEATTPKRTKSKFREELPEYPRTPPLPSSSRPISPTSPYIDHSSKVPSADDEAKANTPLDNVHPIFRDEVAALSRNQSIRTAETPEPPGSGILSQSLASVDSEASWLSGRPAKRSSIPISSLRESGGLDHFRESPNEPYFARRAPSPGRLQGPGGLSAGFHPASSAARADDDDDLVTPGSRATSANYGESAVKYNTVHGGHPTLVRGVQSLRSREGLLDEYAASTASDRQVSPTSDRNVSRFSAVSAMSAYGRPPAEESETRKSSSPDIHTRDSVEEAGEVETSLHRAMSIDYGAGHSRRVSAGSARLLEILPRSGSPEARTKGRDKRSSNLSMELASAGGTGAQHAEDGGRMQGVGEDV